MLDLFCPQRTKNVASGSRSGSGSPQMRQYTEDIRLYDPGQVNGRLSANRLRLKALHTWLSIAGFKPTIYRATLAHV